MEVDLYLYDEHKMLLRPILWGVQKLIHDERDFLLTAEIMNSYAVSVGQFIGFTCDDGRYRLFLVETAAVDVSSGYTTVTATEAAVAELARRIVREVRLEGTYADEAVQAALEESGFVIGKSASGRKGDVSKYYATRWKALREIEAVCNVRILPYFTVENGQITGKWVDIEERTYRRTGRILQKETDATSIQVTYSGTAVGRMYGKGRMIGTEDPPTCVNFAQVAWSTDAGDPMDKPAGQEYLEDPETIARGIEDEDVFENKNIEDPSELLRQTYEALIKRRKPKVQGMATAFDVSYLPGYEHKSVRLFDILDVPTEDGGTVEGIVIDIQRNYINRERTQIVLGEEDESEQTSIVKQVAALKSESVRLRGSSGAASSRYIENRHLIELNANRIVMNAEEILANADRIRLTAGNLEEFEKGTTDRLVLAELTLFGDESGATAGLVARVNDNVAAITAVANDVESRVTIEALEIELKGYVTASRLKTEFSNFESGISDKLYVAALSANTFECSSFSFKGEGISLKSTDYVKSVGRTKRYAMAPSGTASMEFYEISSISNGKLYYLSWE